QPHQLAPHSIRTRRFSRLAFASAAFTSARASAFSSKPSLDFAPSPFAAGAVEAGACGAAGGEEGCARGRACAGARPAAAHVKEMTKSARFRTERSMVLSTSHRDAER